MELFHLFTKLTGGLLFFASVFCAIAAGVLLSKLRGLSPLLLLVGFIGLCLQAISYEVTGFFAGQGSIMGVYFILGLFGVGCTGLILLGFLLLDLGQRSENGAHHG